MPSLSALMVILSAVRAEGHGVGIEPSRSRAQVNSLWLTGLSAQDGKGRHLCKKSVGARLCWHAQPRDALQWKQWYTRSPGPSRTACVT